MSTPGTIAIQNAANDLEECEVDNKALRLIDCLSMEQIMLIDPYTNPVFFNTDDGGYIGETDGEGYEIDKFFTLESSLEEIFAYTSEPILVVGYKVKVHVTYDDKVTKIAASSGIEISDLMDVFGVDVDGGRVEQNNVEVDKYAVLERFVGENEELHITIFN
ncbi:hypothetical protein BX667DRAFT_510041 [Coemansia mojavensis]|nr:hypothetical protein BX667DRAFT_510041 [Coemansia mojavensis]